MTDNAKHAAYTKTHVESASPGQLILALYDGALAAVARAAEAHRAGALETRGLQMDKGQAIIAELIASLDMSLDSPIPRLLFRLYNYLTRRLMDAALRDEPEALDEVKKLLADLRLAWAEAEADHQ